MGIDGFSYSTIEVGLTRYRPGVAGEGAAVEYWPWFFLAQPPPFAERVLAASAEYVVRDILRTWTASPDAISPKATEI